MKDKNVGPEMEKLESLYVGGGNVKWCSSYEKRCGNFFKK
jgi:hypothetical protein